MEDKSKRKQLFKHLRAESEGPQKGMSQLLRDGLKLAYTVLGKNTTNFDDRNLKILSPKLFSVTKSEEEKDEEADNETVSYD